MPINLLTEKGLIGKALKNKFANIWQEKKLSDFLDNHIKEWFLKSSQSIREEDPFLAYREKWKYWNRTFNQKKSSLNQETVSEYQELCLIAGVPFDNRFWQSKLEEKDSGEKELAFRLLLNEWQKNLDKAQAKWELEQISHARQQFLAKLEEWLKLLQELNQQLSGFGLDFGLWFDDSFGNLSPQSIKELKRWATYFAKDKGAQAIADLLGKMRQIEQSSKIETITQTISINTPVVDINSKEEIIGLRLGKDLEYTLPSELALMADPDTAILFDLKYLESKLVCFELQGINYQEEQKEISVEIESQNDEKLGPMILCIDTSGSMNGVPENIAKAMALYLGNKAKEQNRPCFIINFSTGIETFEITATKGIADLVSFLGKSFHGGTDAVPALRQALIMLESEHYKKADVLMISDFVMGELPSSLLDAIKAQRNTGNQFNSLVIGNVFMNSRLKTHFDNEWVFNPHTHQILELVQFNQNIRG